MGERLLCKQEVVGSIPSASTSVLVSRLLGSGRDPSEGNATRKRELRAPLTGGDWSGIMDNVKTIVK